MCNYTYILCLHNVNKIIKLDSKLTNLCHLPNLESSRFTIGSFTGELMKSRVGSVENRHWVFYTKMGSVSNTSK